MGLLKTVFEVNLGLFGKKANDGCVVASYGTSPLDPQSTNSLPRACVIQIWQPHPPSLRHPRPYRPNAYG